MSDQHLLIIEKQPSLGDRLPGLISALGEQVQLDSATARHRLLGQGLAMLAKGVREKLMPLARLLTEHGVRSWLIRPSRPAFAPARVRGLAASEEGLQFFAQKGKVTLKRGEKVVAILADLSGTVAERCRKQLLGQHIYLGREAVAPLDDGKVYRMALQRHPALDLYLFNDNRKVRGAVRIFAGRFDPGGLGERATISAAQNMDQLIKLVREFAGEFSLRVDFGLSQLPGCLLKKPEGETSYDQQNLASLTRYGWLVTDLESQDQLGSETSPVAPVVAALATALQQPALAATAQNPAVLDQTPVLRELKEAVEEQPPSPNRPAFAPAPGPALPHPPEAGTSGSIRWLPLAGNGIAALAVAAVILSKKSPALLPAVNRLGIQTGVLPALFSAALFWSGLHYLRLKRQMENTPTSKARSMAMGLVEVKGKAIRQYALVSPLTQIPCVYYRLRKYRRNNKGNWKVISTRDTAHVPFWIEDDTGRVSVAPAGARIAPRNRRKGDTGGGLNVFLDTPIADPGNEKVVEEIIFEDAELYVLGFARPARAQRGSLRERTIKALRTLKSDPHALHRYDTDGDGRQAVIGKPPGRSLPFVITENESEAHLSRNYGLISIPLLVAALVAALWGLIKIGQMLNLT